MTEEWDGRNAIINRNHMSEMKNRIDLEYQAALRHQEKEREQAEHARAHHVTSLNTRHPTGNMYFTRSYKKPWQSGMTTKKLFSDPPDGERKHKVRDSNTHAKLPPIHKNTETIRRNYCMESQSKKPAAAIQPRIMVQQKRLHTRQPQDNVMVLATGATRRKGGQIPTQTFISHKLNDGKPQNCKDQEKKTRQLSATTPRVKQVVKRWPKKKEVLTSILTTPRDKTPPRLFGGRLQVNRIASNSTGSPLKFFNNDQPEGTLEEHPGNMREIQCEDCTDIGEGSAVSELSIFDSEMDYNSEESETDSDPPEQTENHGSRWSIYSATSPNSDFESYYREAEDGCSSDDEAQSQTSVNVQGEFGDETQDFQYLQEGTALDSRERINVFPSSRFLRTQNIIPAATRVLGQSNGSAQVTSPDLFEVNESLSFNRLDAGDNIDVGSIAHAIDTSSPTVSHLIPVDIRQRQNPEDLVATNSGESPESWEQSTSSSSHYSTSSYAPVDFGTISSAPSIDVLHENLSLVFMTLSMQRPTRNRNSVRSLSITEIKEEAKPDPEKLRKLQESLLQEDSEEEEDICRICLMGGDSSENALISPCQCIGSLKYVHQECMKKWLMAKITTGTDLDTLRTCEMCKQSIQTEINGFNLSEQYQKHQETREQNTLEPSLYLLLLLHLYQQRYEELLRLNRTRDQVTEISRRISLLRLESRENNDRDAS